MPHDRKTSGSPSPSRNLSRSKRPRSPRPSQPLSPPPQPPPRHRLGPRPLQLHLALSLANSMSLPAALFPSQGGLMPWKSRSVQSLAQNLSQSRLQNPLEQVSNALSQVVAQRLSQLARGVERYRLSPYVRDVEDPPPVWQEGSSRLLKFGRRSGVPVFFVPSLINKAYILDLDQERSLVRWLAERGFCVYLLDWGQPSTDERRMVYPREANVGDFTSYSKPISYGATIGYEF